MPATVWKDCLALEAQVPESSVDSAEECSRQPKFELENQHSGAVNMEVGDCHCRQRSSSALLDSCKKQEETGKQKKKVVLHLLTRESFPCMLTGNIKASLDV